MKNNKCKYLAIALCTLGTVAAAQEPATADTVGARPAVRLAFRDVAASDVLVGATSLNYNEVIEKDYMTYPFSDLDAFISGGTNGWGGSYQVLIDGVPRPVDNIKPDEIESISFLKGAGACALYGSHAAKGVVLITTKRGQTGDLRIKTRVNTGWNVAKAYPEYLGAAEYMVLYNQARANDGLDPLYSDEEIYNTASGTNPYRYPDVDFYDSEWIRKAYNRTDATVELDGGSDLARYYANVSYYRNGSYFKEGEAGKSYTDRFNVRGNVDIDISDHIKSYVDANVSFYNSRGYTGANYWSAASTWRPNRMAPFIPVDYIDPNATEAWNEINASSNIIDGKFIGGSLTDKTNVFADMLVSGESKATYRKLQFETGLVIDLSPLTQGLSFATQFGMDYSTSYNQSYSDSYKSFCPIWSNYNGHDVIIGFKDTATEDKHSGVQNLSNSSTDQTYAFDARFNYDRTFGLHSVGAIALLRGFQYRYTGEYHAESDASVGFNVHYDFGKRYFADFSGSVVHTAKLAEGHRNALSSALTLGWNVARESFMEGGIFNCLTVSASLGNLANDVDINGYNSYVGAFSEKGAWWSWNGAQSFQSTVAKRGANEGLDFVRNKEIAVGLRAGIMDDMLTLSASAFVNRQEGLIISSDAQMPEYMMSYYPESSFIPYINYNDDLRRGIDFALGFNRSFGELELGVLLTGMLSTNEAAKRDDTAYEYDYQKREGRYIDGFWGYECLGFFADQADIDASADQTSFGQTIRPGDLKYKDQNADGKIDSKDQVELGRWGNPFTYGVGITAKYRGLTLFVAGSGSYGATASKSGSYYRMSGEDKYSVEARRAWTPETAATASLPRLTTMSAGNNNAESDFWTYKNNRFDIGKVQLTYDLPSTLFEGSRLLREAQVYVSGANLLTLSKEREHLERNVGSAPQARFYNLGIKVTF